MLEFFLLVLLLVYVFRFFAAALRQQGHPPTMADHGSVIEIQSVKEFEEKLQEAQNTHRIVVVDFTATWCGPCRIMSPVFVELSKKHPNLIFLKVDVDKLQEVASRWEVTAMPTFIYIKDNKVADKIVGANKDELERKSLAFATNRQ
ncbi:hypothetical protein R1sor_027561 [Riccia sorocarpa]|uniref:Thioredoxin domain-containing protein n=1 Tax=Riccia sorocarpa TaxID=122646 RepID=A0ABD3GEJ8_9MARC